MQTLKDLLVKEKTIVQSYPGCKDFEITLAYLSKESMNSLRKKATVTTFDRKNHQAVESIDEVIFSKNFVKAVIKDWSGLKYRYLEDLVPVDLSNVEDLDATLEYSEETAEMLLKNSTDFDRWIGVIVNDLQNFTTLK